MGRSRSRSRSRGRRDDYSSRGGGEKRRGDDSSRSRDADKRDDSRTRERSSHHRSADGGGDHRRHHHHHHHHHHHKIRHDDRSKDRHRSPYGRGGRGSDRSTSKGPRDDSRSSKGRERGDGRSQEDQEGHMTKEEGQQQQQPQQQQQEEEDEELALDEASMLLMVGGTDEQEEEKLIAERKRKREEIEAMHRKKAEDEEKSLDKMVEAGKGSRDAEEFVQERKRLKEEEGNGGQRAVKPTDVSAQKEEEEDDADDDAQDAVEVTVHNKPLTEDEKGQEEIERAENTDIMLDMFSLSPGKDFGALKTNAMLSSAAGKGVKDAADNLEDNWDDHEGYYKTLVGELIMDRYLVLGSIGRGVFSTVLKCQDKRNDDALVAIKLIRNNEIMRKAATKELELLREICGADPDNKKHCVRLLDHFEHRNHVALVFESMQMNLRETLRKFGKHVGINITAVRTYAKQLLVSLKHIGNLGIVHADIKPDNILVSEGFSQLKLCDFGSAFKENAPDNDPTPYLVSRFYRAPEIILGFEYNRAVDLWSIGCCLYELFTGRVTFPGSNNSEMLRLMMEIKGGIPAKIIRRHRAAYEKLQLEPFFEADGRFRQQETDPVLKKPTMRLVHFTKPTRDLNAILMKAKAASDDKNLVQYLADLLEKIFVLDPSKRITFKDALHHPFVSASSALQSATGTSRS